MERSLISAWILVLCTTTTISCCQAYYSHTLTSRYVAPKQKVTKLHFFLHDTMSGPNPSAVPVGKFNGSSISIFSRNPITQTERELAVVGGRGKLRMATGFAELNTYFVNITTGDAIVEYEVTVIHY